MSAVAFSGPIERSPQPPPPLRHGRPTRARSRPCSPSFCLHLAFLRRGIPAMTETTAPPPSPATPCRPASRTTTAPAGLNVTYLHNGPDGNVISGVGKTFSKRERPHRTNQQPPPIPSTPSTKRPTPPPDGPTTAPAGWPPATPAGSAPTRPRRLRPKPTPPPPGTCTPINTHARIPRLTGIRMAMPGTC